MTRKEGSDILDAVLDLRAAVEHGFTKVDQRFTQVGERMERGFTRVDDRITTLGHELGAEIGGVRLALGEVRSELGQVRSELTEFRTEVLRELRNGKRSQQD